MDNPGDSNVESTATLSAQDWVETLSRAKEIAQASSQSAINTTNSAYASSAYSSGLSSHANTLDAASPDGIILENGLGLRGGDQRPGEGGRENRGGNVRATLMKHHASRDHDRDRDRDRGGGLGMGLGGASDLDAVNAGGSLNGPPPTTTGRGKRFSKRQSKGVLAAVF